MLITFIIIFLLLSALFSGTEIAFISASKLRIELNRQKGTRRGKILAGFFDKPADFLSTMLVGNNIALVVFTSLMSGLMRPWLIEALHENEPLILLTNTILITIVVLIFGEFLPKTFFSVFADKLLNFLAYPLKFLVFILAVPSWVMTRMSNTVLRLVFRTPMEDSENALTRLDLEDFIQGARTDDSKEDIDTILFENALHLQKTKVKDCMVPRTEIIDIDVNAEVGDLKKVFMESNLSRIIVTGGDIDNVLGYVHHQQMMKDPTTIMKMTMELPFVPEAMKATDLLNSFIKNQNNIACVVDEFGGVAGIITLEDIMEEIFGEIEDEYDQEEYVEIEVQEAEWIFSGRLEIDYLNDKYELIDFPEGDYHTLSGYIVMTTATIPEQGAEIELHGYKFILELVSETKIETVRVIKMESLDEKMDK